MDILRFPNRLRWWIVAWLFCGLGAALASPLVRPHSMELACSAASGTTLVVHAKTGNAVLDALDLNCLLCLPGSAPPPPACHAPPALAVAMPPPAQPPGAPTPTPTAAPPPARAPPLSPSVFPS
jgi:hypothetical protein